MQYNAKAAKVSYRNRQNREQGNQFEDIIERSCEYYRRAGIADIEKTPEPVRVLSKVDQYGRFTGCFEKKAQPDYKGTLNGGTSIVFDAKSTTTEKIAVSVLSDEQRKDLLNHSRLGAEAGVMMCFSFKAFYYIPIMDFLNAKDLNGHAYWTAEDAHKYGYDCGFVVDIDGNIRVKFINAED